MALFRLLALGGDGMEGLKNASRMAPGSLPMTDPQDAVRFQCQAFPEAPAWPQLPKRSPLERITRQGLGSLHHLEALPDGNLQWREPPEGWGSLSRRWAAERGQGIIESGALTAEEASGFFAFMETASRHFRPETSTVKGQLAGPVTLGASIRTPTGRPLLEDGEAMTALAQHLSLGALWQCRRLSQLGKQVVFFLDEPSMGTFDPLSFGRSCKDVQEWFSIIYGPLQEEGFLTGIHLCGPGPYRWALESSVECIHLDGYRYLDSLVEDAKALQHYLSQGGWIVFGMVPTAMSGGTFPEAAALVDRWMGFAYGMGRQGVDPEMLAQRTLFSTSCGLGAGTLAVAEEAARCLSGLTSLWRITAGMGLFA